jgi:hypothetical protein
MAADLEVGTGVDSEVDMAAVSEVDMETVVMEVVATEAGVTVEVAAMAGIKERICEVITNETKSN